MSDLSRARCSSLACAPALWLLLPSLCRYSRTTSSSAPSCCCCCCDSSHSHLVASCACIICRSEDAEFRASATAQRREEMKRRADERAAAAEAEAAAAREAAAAARRGEREAQLAELGQLALQAQVKQLELACAKRLARRQKLLAFCVTAAQPPLYWAPREPCDETAAASTAAAAAFDAWRTEQLQQLEEEKAALEQRAAEKRAAAVARGGRATAVAAAAGDGEADAPGSDGEESGSEEACLGVDEQPHDAADGECLAPSIACLHPIAPYPLHRRRLLLSSSHCCLPCRC